MNLHSILERSADIFPLKPADTVEFAIEMMADNRVFSMPVAKNDIHLGSVYLNNLIEANSSESIENKILKATDAKLLGTENIYEVLTKLNMFNADCLPLVDKENKVLGCVRLWDVLGTMSQSVSFHQDGGSLVVELSSIQYSLSKLCQICEYEGSQVLGVLVDKMDEESSILQVHLKLNAQNLDRVVGSMIRYGYDVPYYSQEGNEPNLLKDRYDSLMKYLDI